MPHRDEDPGTPGAEAVGERDTTERRRPRWLRQRWRRLAVGAGLLAVLIQLVPYGRDHASGGTTAEPAWDSQQTRTLFVGACGDCHSNLTKWPWYSNVAPISWLTQSDVDGGRRVFDVSTWDTSRHEDVKDMVRAIVGGEMPPFYYKPMHPASRLSASEQAALIDGLRRTFADPAP
jgi:hypothetical protein